MNLLGLFRSSGNKFYHWFEEASRNNHEAALLLDKLCRNIEINRLENEADDLLRENLTALFKNPRNPVDVIRWRDIYGIMEDITDKTEDIANTLRNLTTKYA